MQQALCGWDQVASLARLLYLDRVVAGINAQCKEDEYEQYDPWGGNTALHFLCDTSRDLRQFEVLISYGANPFIRNQYGLPPR